MATILVVEDEESVRFFTTHGLRKLGWVVREASSGEAALTKLAETSFDIVLLDLHLPEMDGVSVMKEIANQWPETTVIIMTAYATLDSAIEAVRQGAFDYLQKPCSIADIKTSIDRAMSAKKTQQTIDPSVQDNSIHEDAPSTKDMVISGSLVIALKSRSVSLNETPVSLTPTEYEVLSTLARSVGQPASRQKLLQEALGYEPGDFQALETLRVHISHLRRKLGRDYIITTREGYMLAHFPEKS